MVKRVLRDLERLVRTTAKRNEVTWRYGLNLVPTLSHQMGSGKPSSEAERVLGTLNRDGVAITTLEALVGDADGQQLFAATSEWRLKEAGKIEAARAALLDPNSNGQKPFVVPLLGQHPALDRANPLAQFALHPNVLQVVNGYYGMHVRLRHYNIWQNLKTTRPATQSQLWHRDPEDRYILKLFVALEDVDEGSGPFTYAAGSHRKGLARTVPEYTHKDGGTPRSNDQQMAAAVPAAQWVTCTGAKGTVIFADTQGYHRGGLARDHDRVLFIAEYTSLAGGRGGISTKIQ